MVGTRSTRNKGKEPIREPLRERTLSYDDPNALGEAGENQAARRKSYPILPYFTKLYPEYSVQYITNTD